MRGGVKRVLSLVALCAMALHTVLWAFATPLAAGETSDPFSVICHSGPQTAAPERAPAAPPSVPTSACDHCNLCSAAPMPAALDDVLAFYLRPAIDAPLPFAIAAAPRDGEPGSPHRARGPPQPT